MKIRIREELPDDYASVFTVIKRAFEFDEYSNQKEQYLVEKLRKSVGFLKELSLVALIDGRVIGHILLTPIVIINEFESFDSLALAPVSVSPEFQNLGIGSKLIKKAHKKAKKMGFTSVVLIGHEGYYPRFGYEIAKKYGIRFPYEAPEENCMVKSLTKKGLKGVSGVVKYPPEFSEL